MVSTATYASVLEKKLISKFSKEFYDKLGYYPTVITKSYIDTEKDGIHLMSLEQLESYFIPFLPRIFKKPILSLGDRSRMRELVELRHIFFYIAKSFGFSLSSIGIYLNKRDHTTVIHGIRTFRDLVETDPNFKQKYNEILNHIKQNHHEYNPSVMDSSDQV